MAEEQGSHLNPRIHILLVEDDDVDAELVIRAFRRERIENPFTIVHDGLEALDVLRGTGGCRRIHQPYIILLDINMPRMNGIEFLQALRKDSHLKQSIVFVLSTSNGDEDRLAAYERQVAGYLLKANAGDDFRHVIRLIDIYRCIVEFPPEAT
jgi:CheY-like chemotaxis protein